MTSPVAAVLLTGGASVRMGSPKAELVVDGVRLADRAAGLLAEVAHPVLEIGPGYTALPRVDEGPPHRGPLAALAAAVPHLPEDRPALVVGVDMPRLTTALLAALGRHPSADTVIPVDGDRHLQPLCARYAPDALAHAPLLVAAGASAMRALLNEVTWEPWPLEAWQAFAPIDAFFDLDTPADLARYGT